MKAHLSRIVLIIIFPLLFLTQCDQKHEIIFPEPFAVIVDDMGWMGGSDLSINNGPYRLGTDRTMEKRDYTPFVEIGEELGIRFQGAFILSEMDMENILANYPSTSEFGATWDNSDKNKDSLWAIMEYVKDNAAFIEFALHGIRHEYWQDGVASRAEWYDMYGGKPWPEDQIRARIELFKDIMAQYGITEENGQSFPESFVPTAYAFQWNPDGDMSTAKIFTDYGVKYANTNMRFIQDQNPPVLEGGGLDHGIHFLHRLQYGNDWNQLAALPDKNFSRFETDCIEAHWTNFLAGERKDQSALNKDWIQYLRDIQKDKDHYLAKNTEQLHSQWLYNKYTVIKQLKDSIVIIDNTEMPAEIYESDLLGNMVLAIKLEDGEHLTCAKINEEPIASYYETEGYGYLYLPVLSRKVYTLTYGISDIEMPYFVDNTGTYNVYEFEKHEDMISFDLKMYGTQDVLVKSFEPDTVYSTNPYLYILDNKYDPETSFLTLKVHGRDMQGERGGIVIKRLGD